MLKDLKYYCFKFENLRRDYKNGGAPHKPILLISLIQAFQQNLFKSNQITIIPEFVGLFKSNWNSLVNSNHTCLFTLPFYHMSSEPFWSLIPNIGCEIWVQSKSSMRSFSNLTTAIKYALIDEELKNLLIKKEDSDILLHFILDKYFPDTKNNFNAANGNNYITEIENQIVQDSQENYQKRILKIRKDLDTEEFQEEVFIRSNIFKKEIPKVYNFTCCISGMRIDATENISMIDACHIIPFSLSYNDTISNGIALCPNLHRAFDRGLIGIDEKYRVVVSKSFIEEKSPYSIYVFEGKQIKLPQKEYLLPHINNFKWHIDNVLKK
ncbi:MAG: HNH endonuclease [Bacteroidales bacterium]